MANPRIEKYLIISTTGTSSGHTPSSLFPDCSVSGSDNLTRSCPESGLASERGSGLSPMLFLTSRSDGTPSSGHGSFGGAAPPVCRLAPLLKITSQDTKTCLSQIYLKWLLQAGRNWIYSGFS